MRDKLIEIIENAEPEYETKYSFRTRLSLNQNQQPTTSYQCLNHEGVSGHKKMNMIWKQTHGKLIVAITIS